MGALPWGLYSGICRPGLCGALEGVEEIEEEGVKLLLLVLEEVEGVKVEEEE